MNGRYRCWINGQCLQDIDPDIYILDIQESKPKKKIITADSGRINGTKRLRSYRESLSVTISVEVHEKRIDRRTELIEHIAEWARTGYFTANHQTGKRLQIDETEPPVTSSALKWTDALQITLTAYEKPFWENEAPSTASIEWTSGTAASEFFQVTGAEAADALVEASITNDGTAACNSLTLTVNSTRFEFSSLGLAAGKTLVISYDAGGYLHIAVDGTSKLEKRTTSSSDDLLAHGGRNTITLIADKPASATVTARGNWL